MKAVTSAIVAVLMLVGLEAMADMIDHHSSQIQVEKSPTGPVANYVVARPPVKPPVLPAPPRP